MIAGRLHHDRLYALNKAETDFELFDFSELFPSARIALMHKLTSMYTQEIVSPIPFRNTQGEHLYKRCALYRIKI